MIDDIIDTAQKAGEQILTYYSGDIDVYHKDDDSPLTQADLASQKVIVDGLNMIGPDTPVISEEAELPDYEVRKDWDKFWLVDPLDGTKEFIKRNGEFTVNIALIAHGEPVLGVLYIPVKERLYYAQKDKGSFCRQGSEQAKQIYSKPADKSTQLKVAASRSHRSDSLENELNKRGIQVDEFIPAGSSLKFCLVAEGTVDIYPRTGTTMEWDVGAGDCIYRNSVKNGEHHSPLRYNKPDLRNEGFLIGL